MIPIVFSTDENFIMQTGVAILSLLTSKKKEDSYKIYILVDMNVTKESKDKLSKLVRQSGSTMKFITMDKTFDDVYETRGITKATYYRLLIPWLIPDCDKIIYADGDIIFKGSLKEVFNVDLKDNYLAGVRSIGIRLFKDQYIHVRNLGVDPDCYINAGFIVINSKQMRKDNLKSIFLKEIRHNYTYQDQDILNKVCKNRIQYLPLNFNFPPSQYFKAKLVENKNNIQLGLSSEEIEVEKMVVLHYIGKKPWSYPVFCFLDWWETYRESPFYEDSFEIKFSYRNCFPPTSFKEVLLTILRFLKIK